ncbi:tetratricopeptide repeat protein, partial [Candidatus Fermentibacterales bacterium]|nr:tetratricopeptide repeat protein [Candidatus Fermentibacterales bacterium]
ERLTSWLNGLHCPCPAGPDQIATPSERDLWLLMSGEGPEDEDALPDPEELQRRAAIALRDTIRLIASGHSTVALALDDLQWADRSSLEVLDFMLDNCDTQFPLILFLLHRPEGLFEWRAGMHGSYSDRVDIRLERVSDGGCSDLIRHMLGGSGAVGRDPEKFLLQASRGNPYFLEELLIDLVESGRMARSIEGGGWILTCPTESLRVPGSIEGLIRSRMDRMPSELRRAAQCASVLEPEFGGKMFERVWRALGFESLATEQLERLAELELLEITESPGQEPSYAFRHSLTRRSVYETMLHYNRSLLHGHAARACVELAGQSGERLSAVIATHFDLAGDTAKAVEWGMRALEDCERSYEIRQGLDWVDRLEEWLLGGGVEADPDIPDRAGRLLDVLSTKQYLQSFGTSNDLRLATCERMVDLASSHPDGYLLAGSLLWRGSCHDVAGSTEKAERDFLRAIEIARERDERDHEASALGRLFSIRRSQGRLAEAERMMLDALEISRSLGDLRLESVLIGRHLSMLFDMGRIEEAEDALRRSMEIAERLDDRRALGYAVGRLGVVLIGQGRLDEAMEKLLESLRLGRETGDRAGEGVDLANIGAVYVEKGMLDEAIPYFEESLEIDREVGNRRSEGVQYGNLALLRMEKGERDRAMELFEKALAIHRETGNRKSEGMVLCNLGDHYASGGEHEKALECLDRSLRLAREVGDRRSEGTAMGSLAECLRRQERIEEAARAYESAISIHREVGSARAEAVDLANLGAMWLDAGMPTEAAQCLDRAREALAPTGLPPGGVGKIRDLEARLEPVDPDFERPTGGSSIP